MAPFHSNKQKNVQFAQNNGTKNSLSIYFLEHCIGYIFQDLKKILSFRNNRKKCFVMKERKIALQKSGINHLFTENSSRLKFNA